MDTEKESDLAKTRKAGELVKKVAPTDPGPDVVEAVNGAYPILPKGMRGIIVPLRNRIRQLEQELEQCRKSKHD